MKPAGRTDEQWRLECEARQWITWGYTTKAMVDALITEIAKKRGKDAAGKLREEMRTQYRSVKKEGNR